MSPRLAWLGVGHLARYCVPPLVERLGPVTLSPRGAAAAQALAREQGLPVAADNAALVAGADVIFLAPRPADALAACAGLPWRAGQTVISLCAGLPLAAVQAAVAPARACRAMPVLAARWGEGPTLLLPALPEAEAVLRPWGPVIVPPDEATFEAAASAAVFYSWLMRLQADLGRTLAEAGLPPAEARLLAAQTFRAVGTVGREDPQDLDSIWRTLCSPGSFSRHGLELLERAQALAPWSEATRRVMELMRRAD